MYYLTEFCCLCLKRNKHVTPQNSINPNAKEIMEFIIPKFVLQMSEIPIQICDICLNYMNNFFKFKQSCLENIITFSECVQKLIKKHGPHEYLLLRINEISCDIAVENHHRVENSEEPNSKVVIKSEILEDNENRDYLSTENQNENGNEILEQVLIKVENSVDSLYELGEINEEFMIKEDPNCADNDVEDNSNINVSAQKQRSLEVGASKNVANTNATELTLKSEDADREEQFKCNMCRTIFSKKCELEFHARLHTVGRRFSCDICRQQFSSSHLLTKHKLVHTSEALTRICPETNEGLGDQSTSKSENVNKEERFECYMCETTFSKRYELDAHAPVHVIGRRYRCDICGQSFISSLNLMRHKVIHTDKKLTSDCPKTNGELIFIVTDGTILAGNKTEDNSNKNVSTQRQNNFEQAPSPYGGYRNGTPMKKCFVPGCDNNTETNPNYIFLTVPRNEAIRIKWFNAVSPGSKIVTSGNLYCCEDHFDLQEDSKNWLYFKTIGERIQIKKEALPRKQRVKNSPTLTESEKKRKEENIYHFYNSKKRRN